MKKYVFFCIGLFFFSFCGAQEIDSTRVTTVKSIENGQNQLLVNSTVALKKGDKLQIWIPAGREDFIFVKRVKKGLGTGLLKGAVGAIGTGAAAVGMGTSNVNTAIGAIKVADKASSVAYGIETVEQIQNLPMSKKAKKIAGKNMVITDWDMDDNGWWVNGKIDKKPYRVLLQEAVPAGEVKLIDTSLESHVTNVSSEE